MAAVRWNTLRQRYWPVWGLIAANVVFGLLTFRSYGLSMDEPLILEYAKHVVSTYGRNPLVYVPFTLGNLDYYGPAYFVLANGFAKLSALVLPGAGYIAFWHLAGFLFFQLGVFSIYELALRWMDRWGAFGAALLFATQPLLWGHAFINPKDSPFMVLFLASVTSGLIMADHVLEIRGGEAEALKTAEPPHTRRPSTPRSSTAKLALGLVAFGIGACVLGAAFAARGQIMNWLGQRTSALAPTNLIRTAYGAITEGQLADIIRTYVIGGRALIPGLLLLVLLVSLILMGMTALGLAKPDQARWSLRRFGGSFRDWRVIGAGVLLGLATSTRILGPYAGGLVVAWMLVRGRWKALSTVLAYLTVAALVAYLTWPYIWGNPVTRIIAAAKLMSSYPWPGQVLFGGRLYSGSDLPLGYIPTLISVQLTEPTLILFAFSVPLVVYRFVKTRTLLDLILLLLLWLVLPAAGAAAAHATIYNNLRQLHFLLPPIFIYAGFAISFIVGHLRWGWLRLSVLLAIALPGMLAIGQLHPYEYAYYNQFAGGQAGAFRRFDADYWATSSAEAARYLDQIAGPGSKILVPMPASVFRPYARQDLQIRQLGSQTLHTSAEDYDYLVVSTKQNEDLRSGLADLPTLAAFGRKGMTFVMIKKGAAPP
jgi:hypothetical protein